MKPETALPFWIDLLMVKFYPAVVQMSYSSDVRQLHAEVLPQSGWLLWAATPEPYIAIVAISCNTFAGEVCATARWVVRAHDRDTV